MKLSLLGLTTLAAVACTKTPPAPGPPAPPTGPDAGAPVVLDAGPATASPQPDATAAPVARASDAGAAGDAPAATPSDAAAVPLDGAVVPIAHAAAPPSVHATSAGSGTTHPPVAAAPGILRLRVIPWANVTVDGHDYGQTPLAPLTLPAGHHTVHLTNTDLHVDRTTSFNLPPGANQLISVDLHHAE